MAKKLKKKGVFLSQALPDIYAIVIFVFLIILFFFLFKLSARSTQDIITGQADNADMDRLLTEMLRTETSADIDGDGINEKLPVAEMIMHWYYDKRRLDSVLEIEIEKVLKDMQYEYVHPVTKNNRRRAFKMVLGYPTRTAFNTKEEIKGPDFSGPKGCTMKPGAQLCTVYHQRLPLHRDDYIHVGLMDSNEGT